jgi:predicted RNase H-like nuclease
MSATADKIVAGADGTPDGWAFVLRKESRAEIRVAASLSDFLDTTPGLDIIAVDVPIGLLDAYEVGGRLCDRQARALLGKRGSSVFPAPVRGTLYADSYDEACRVSRASAPCSKALTKQTFAIIPKIRKVDELLRARPTLCDVVREVHPEVCFRELAGGQPMTHPKTKPPGREERRRHLLSYFPDLDAIEKAGREQRVPIEDVLDATVACWSALRLATGRGRSLCNPVPFDSKGLPM